MFGDYISTSIVGGKAVPVISVAKSPSGGLFDQAMYAPSGGLALATGTAAAGESAPAASHGPTPAPRARGPVIVH
jgi:hypothetical protein